MDTALTTDPAPTPLRLARMAARAGLDHRFKVWHFGDSVYFDSLVELADRDRECGPEFLAFAYGMTKAWIAHTGYEFRDHTAPGAAIVEVWRHTGDPNVIDAAVRLAGLWDRFPRCADVEAYLHTVPQHSNVAIDCAHFDGPFFAKLAAATGDERYVSRAVYELTWRLRLLQDERTGLCDHSYLSDQGRRGGMLWGRGQGWALLGLVETLRVLPEEVDGRPELTQRLQRLADGLVAHQSMNGHWHTIVDDRSSYLESSTAAFFVAAVCPAIDAELLPADTMRAPLDAAWRAVQSSVRSDGVLTGVSAETPTWLSPTDYRTVATGGTYPWGQGPLVLAALRSARIAHR